MSKQNILDWSLIDNVIFDLDRTLFATHLYFKYHMIRLAKDILKELYPKLPRRKINKGALLLIEDSNASYRKTLEPIGLYNMLRGSTINLYGIDLNENEKLYKYLSKEEETFYTTSPKLYHHSLKVIHMLLGMNKNVAMHSHAQNIWTKAKVDHIKDMYKHKYKEDINPMYYSTCLEDKKDSDAWLNACKQFKFDPLQTLVVGDNLMDDIYASKDAGIKYLVWLRHKIDIPMEIDKDILVVNGIKNILKL